MRVVWDPRKANRNWLKHGVRFSDAEGVLFDPLAVTCEDDSSPSELRYVTVGLDHLGRVLVVIHASGEGGVRIISARRATRRERTQYEEGV